MSADYIYEKAPLIEVIAEVHWALKSIDVAPEARLDPYYDIFRDAFLEASRAESLVHVQELIPSAVPPEIVPHRPQLRLRTKPNTWPLVQVGPGVLTSNIVPPYEGWSAFSPFLRTSIARLFSCYPLAEKTLRISRLHLRYIDGFDESFGMNDYTSFAKSHLGVEKPLSEKFIKESVSPNSEMLFVLENIFANQSPENSTGRIKFSPGERDGRKSMIMELICESSFDDRSATSLDFISSWFDEAHHRLRAQFESIATDNLKAVMGERRAIK